MVSVRGLYIISPTLNMKRIHDFQGAIMCKEPGRIFMTVKLSQTPSIHASLVGTCKLGNLFPKCILGRNTKDVSSQLVREIFHIEGMRKM
jgi:hypothetical protein